MATYSLPILYLSNKFLQLVTYDLQLVSIILLENCFFFLLKTRKIFEIYSCETAANKNFINNDFKSINKGTPVPEFDNISVGV